MKTVIIGISGAYSGVGKTAVASLILRRLKGWGAIKYTKTTIYSSVTDDIASLSEEGKDTKILLDSGSERVLWVRSPHADREAILQMAVERLRDLEGILVEGNSAVEFLKPDIVIFVSGDEKEFKEGAGEIMSAADIVIYPKNPPEGIPVHARRFRWDNIQECVDYVVELVHKENKKGK